MVHKLTFSLTVHSVFLDINLSTTHVLFLATNLYRLHTQHSGSSPPKSAQCEFTNPKHSRVIKHSSLIYVDSTHLGLSDVDSQKNMKYYKCCKFPSRLIRCAISQNKLIIWVFMLCVFVCSSVPWVILSHLNWVKGCSQGCNSFDFMLMWLSSFQQALLQRLCQTPTSSMLRPPEQTPTLLLG